jgi:3-oxoacyl-[acyl-carrier protein] reductase
MDLGIAGRVALVTAASKGPGRASALALAEEGCRVVICARGESSLHDAETAIAATGVEVLAIAADVTDPSTPARLVDAAVERFGGLDILVANAGGPPQARAIDVTDEQIAAAVNANLTTSVRLVRAAVPQMRRGRWGRVCLVTSASIKQPIPDLALSNLARTGLWSWAKTLSRDLAGEGITVNTAAPGLHATDRMKELGARGDVRLGDPAGFGRVVAFLCSEPAAYVTGAALQVDGGATVGLL